LLIIDLLCDVIKAQQVLISCGKEGRGRGSGRRVDEEGRGGGSMKRAEGRVEKESREGESRRRVEKESREGESRRRWVEEEEVHREHNSDALVGERAYAFVDQ
jgi:hypothetical protein